ncbi:glutaredoxin family protein [Agaribacter flavus]|uniref:Glutaredoxin family protein n=1 Tax=Agaribacter flavus TaxID=1902781 RepID=A0ABV7FPG5_9ALTE
MAILSAVSNLFFSFFGSSRESAKATIAFQDLSLYHRSTCPYCLFVMSFMRGQGISINKHNISAEPNRQAELIEQGGKRQVPCLRIKQAEGDVWLYESADIIEYLRKRIDKRK